MSTNPGFVNRTVKKTPQTATNAEGAEVFKLPPEVSLFLQASCFKPRSSFYHTAEEHLENILLCLDEIKNDEYKCAVALVLSQAFGIRLSPVVILTNEALKMKGEEDNSGYKELIRETSLKVFDRPDKIANSFALASYLGQDPLKAFPPFYKDALSKCLESMSERTLKARRMKNKEYSLAWLIKKLHPKPKNDKMSALYKAIIENRKEAALQKETAVSVLSSTEMSDTEKQTWLQSNIAQMSLNSLIRNLSSIEPTPEACWALEQKLSNALKIQNGIPSTKVCNPFDLLNAALSSHPQFSSIIDAQLGIYINGIDLGLSDKKVAVLIDKSGSMGFSISNVDGKVLTCGNAMNTVTSYLALMMKPISKAKEVSFFLFDTNHRDVTQHYKKYMAMAHSPISLKGALNITGSGGTALAQTVRKVKEQHNPDVMIVFSDEVSWASDAMPNNVDSEKIFDIGCTVIAVNPATVGQTVFSPNKPIVRLSSLDAKILYYIPMFSNPGKFKDLILSWSKELI